METEEKVLKMHTHKRSAFILRKHAFHRSLHGFTLVELLVVIVIIGILMGLLTPAIIAARATARKTQCMNNMKNLGDALIQFDLARHRFPGYADRMPGQKDTDGNQIPVSWAVMILPNIQRTDIWDILRGGTELVSNVNVEIDLFACPSDHEKASSNHQSYVVNTGLKDVIPSSNPPDWPANGVFLDRFTTRQYSVTASRITDGTQHTLLLSENIQAGKWNESFDPSDTSKSPKDMEDKLGMIWRVVGTNPSNNPLSTPEGYQINYDKEYEEPTINHARPSSNHSGGVNVAFCDGHAQFLREDIDYGVLARLLTPDGKNAMPAGSTDPADKVLWQNVPLNADDYIK